VRDMTAPYVEGESGQHKKVKFWKTLEAIVVGPSPRHKNSVRLACYDDRGTLHEICGIKLKDEKLTTGYVVEVKYLYATSRNHIVQPQLLRRRTDKQASLCTMSQLVIGKNQ